VDLPGIFWAAGPNDRNTGSSKLARRVDFPDRYYALIAVMSGWMPMMFMTRVRL
jgi:hypothetical protein